jgi:uncharacterized membrane protein
MRSLVSIVAALPLFACGGPEQARDAPPATKSEAPAAATTPLKEPETVAPRWSLQGSSGGGALVLGSASGKPAMRLLCAPAGKGLLVNVPTFRPVGSEERLSFGSGGEVMALVADARGDRERGGVSATGALPPNLEALLAGPVSASYGTQTSGPHPAPPAAMARDFAAACRKAVAPEAPPPSPAARGPAAAGACFIQGSERLPAASYRAVGTEPFWAARIEGRCVTYAHPEDQKGTRVWTRFTPAPGGGTWSGALGGRPFTLTLRPRPGCSDGMSDKSYPLAVDLDVAGERRTGCAAPL